MKLSMKENSGMSPEEKRGIDEHYGTYVDVFYNGELIRHIVEVDEKSGRIERLVLNPDTTSEQKFLHTLDGKETLSEVLYGKVEIKLKPDAYEGARLWFEKVRQQEVA
jgi:hypothetical protein